LEAWQDPAIPKIVEVTPTEVTPTIQLDSEGYTPEHVLMILSFDSTLPANINPPLHRGQANYSFTVKQRALAEEAQTVHSLDELEDAVISFQRYMLTILTISYSWIKCLEKVIALMTHLCDWIQTCFQSGK
jgi:hypothetical protein